MNTIPYLWLLLTREERWSSDNRVVILTLIIHWLGPPLTLPWSSTAMLAVYSGRLAKGPYQESSLAGSETRTCNPVIAIRGFLPIELSCPCTKTLGLKDYINREIIRVPFILVFITWYELSLSEETTPQNWGILPEGRFPRIKNHLSISINQWLNQSTLPEYNFLVCLY